MNEKLIKDKTRQEFDRVAINDIDIAEPKKCYGFVVDLVEDSRSSILDIGCGMGNVLEMVSKKNSHIKLFGIDLSPEMVKKSQARLGDRAKILEGDVENLPFEDHMFDIVTCMHSFHHYPNPSKAVCEMYRVSNTNGKVVLVDNYLPPIRRVIYNIWKKVTNYKMGDVRFYSEKEMKDIFLNSGFSTFTYKMITENSFMCEATK